MQLKPLDRNRSPLTQTATPTFIDHRQGGSISDRSSWQGKRCRASDERGEGWPAARVSSCLGRVLKEKAESDFNRVFKGVSKTRENLAVIDELLTYWNLNEADTILEELEEVRSVMLRMR